MHACLLEVSKKGKRLMIESENEIDTDASL
jgi:hypothetical protein